MWCHASTGSGFVASSLNRLTTVSSHMVRRRWGYMATYPCRSCDQAQHLAAPTTATTRNCTPRLGLHVHTSCAAASAACAEKTLLGK